MGTELRSFLVGFGASLLTGMLATNLGCGQSGPVVTPIVGPSSASGTTGSTTGSGISGTCLLDPIAPGCYSGTFDQACLGSGGTKISNAGVDACRINYQSSDGENYNSYFSGRSEEWLGVYEANGYSAIPTLTSGNGIKTNVYLNSGDTLVFSGTSCNTDYCSSGDFFCSTSESCESSNNGGLEGSINGGASFALATGSRVPASASGYLELGFGLGNSGDTYFAEFTPGFSVEHCEDVNGNIFTCPN